MALLGQLLSDDVGVMSLIVICLTTVVVCGAIYIVNNKVKKAGPNE
ncbi:DUF3149 domain-containing protein [uncultured Aquitalea sp.]|nr:DUF3149 domain-containing protein [uncultured Aquitalea sp.]